MAFNYEHHKETEHGYPVQALNDRPGNYSFVRTGTCLNTMYLGGRHYTEMDGRICPKCGRTIRIIHKEIEGNYE